MNVGPNDRPLPRTWKSFIGQEQVRRQMAVASTSAAKRRKAVPHMLFTSGFGDWAAAAMASLLRRRGSKMIALPAKPHLNTIRSQFVRLEDGDFLLIDEINAFAKSEWLLPYLERGVFHGRYGPEEVSAVTIVARSSNVSKLPLPLVDAFLRADFLPYTDAEGCKIAALRAGSVLAGLPMPSKKALADVALASGNDPRNMRRILTAMRDLLHVAESMGKYDVADAVRLSGITPDARWLTPPVLPAGSTGGTAFVPRLIRGHRDAELAVRDWLRASGYPDAELTPAGADGGIDVLASGAVAQVKAEMLPIGRPIIQQIAGIAAVESKVGFCFSLAGFTPEAAGWANRAGVLLYRFDFQGTPEAV
jgi:hypothetical protein